MIYLDTDKVGARASVQVDLIDPKVCFSFSQIETFFLGKSYILYYFLVHFELEIAKYAGLTINNQWISHALLDALLK